jgi:hypothetical protein
MNTLNVCSCRRTDATGFVAPRAERRAKRGSRKHTLRVFALLSARPWARRSFRECPAEHRRRRAGGPQLPALGWQRAGVHRSQCPCARDGRQFCQDSPVSRRHLTCILLAERARHGWHPSTGERSRVSGGKRSRERPAKGEVEWSPMSSGHRCRRTGRLKLPALGGNGPDFERSRDSEAMKRSAAGAG